MAVPGEARSVDRDQRVHAAAVRLQETFHEDFSAHPLGLARQAATTKGWARAIPGSPSTYR